MDFIISILTIIFVAVLIGTALTFGVALFVAILGMGAMMAAYFLVRQRWQRWRFLHHAKKRENEATGRIMIIETDYEDVTDKKR